MNEREQLVKLLIAPNRGSSDKQSKVMCSHHLALLIFKP